MTRAEAIERLDAAGVRNKGIYMCAVLQGIADIGRPVSPSEAQRILRMPSQQTTQAAIKRLHAVGLLEATPCDGDDRRIKFLYEVKK